MKILVTGATGFLGRFLCSYLEKQDHEIVKLSSKNCNLFKEDSLEQFNNLNFDQIYHLAAWTQAGDFCLKYPGDQWINNQKINTNVLTWWKTRQQQAKLICMGTSCSYSPSLPLSEDNFLKGEPIGSLLTYAMTKRMLLYGLQSINKQYGLNYLYVVPSTLYGPNYHKDGRQMHFIFDLIRKVFRGKIHNDEVVLWGDGYQKRELVYVADFVETLVKLVQIRKNEVINIGLGNEHTIRECAKEICHILSYDFKNVQYDTTKYVGAKSKVLNIDKLLSIFPEYSPKCLTEGLDLTINWFEKNKEILLS